MSAVHVVTGAAGHLGTAVVRALLDDGRTVRALALPGQELLAASLIDEAARARLSRRDADVTDRASLDAALADLVGEDLVVIHTAGLISIGHLPVARLRQVNVRGTAAVLAAARAVGARRLVHVSSVHAAPEPSDPTEVIREVDDPDAYDPRAVRGGYARSKAEATRGVLRENGIGGLEALVVQPSRMIGPWDDGANHLVDLIDRARRHRMPAVVPGGYDVVDVRDVADAVVAAAELGFSPRPLADSVHDTVDGLERR